MKKTKDINGIQLSPVTPVGGGLAGAVREEIRLLDKKVELLKLRIEESPNTQQIEYVRIMGRELWRCSLRLEKALAGAGSGEVAPNDHKPAGMEYQCVDRPSIVGGAPQQD